MQMVPIDKVIPAGTDQDPRIVAKLAEQIKTSGRIDPIEVTQHGDEFDIEDGNHRYAAAKQLGKTQVPIQVIQTKGERK